MRIECRAYVWFGGAMVMTIIYMKTFRVIVSSTERLYIVSSGILFDEISK